MPERVQALSVKRTADGQIVSLTTKKPGQSKQSLRNGIKAAAAGNFKGADSKVVTPEIAFSDSCWPLPEMPAKPTISPARAGWIQLGGEFHLLLAQLAGNQVLQRFMAELVSLIEHHLLQIESRLRLDATQRKRRPTSPRRWPDADHGAAWCSVAAIAGNAAARKYPQLPNVNNTTASKWPNMSMWQVLNRCPGPVLVLSYPALAR
jgi:hypothetical protein